MQILSIFALIAEVYVLILGEALETTNPVFLKIHIWKLEMDWTSAPAKLCCILKCLASL